MPEDRVLNELIIKSYDRTIGYGKYPIVNHVIESTYLSEKSLTIDEFNEILSKHHEVNGENRYKKYKLTYSSGKILYKHVLFEETY